MDFRWSMNEDDFERMKAHIGTKEWISDNCYRGVAIGSMLWEFVTYDVDKENKLFANVYEAGVGTGYGNLEDGTPYDNVDCFEGNHLGLITSGSFDDFKNSVEHAIIALSCDETHLKEMMDSDMKPMWYGFRKD